MKRYDLKKEFFVQHHISIRQWDRRKKDLLEWLKNFFDYELIEDHKPIQIIIHEQFGPYQPMPKKVEENQKIKEKKYEAFIIAALGTEYKPNSKTKVARDAINNFARRDFGHTSQEAVSRRFVSKPFEKYGETNNVQRWVYYPEYTPLSDDVLEDLRRILREERIDIDEAASAFYRSEQGEDISQERQYFKRARERFLDKYGKFPVLVKEWKCKN